MTMNMLNAVAQFERDLLIERMQSGLKRAKLEGKALGRPLTSSDKQKQDVCNDLATRIHDPFDLGVRFRTVLVPTPYNRANDGVARGMDRDTGGLTAPAHSSRKARAIWSERGLTR